MRSWDINFKNDGKIFFEPHEYIEELIKIMRDNNVVKILDLGCGSGRHVVLLKKEGFDIYGMDNSPEGLKLTEQWLGELDLTADLHLNSCYESFPFPDNFFDAVISTQVIHHATRDKIKYCISEIERVLVPDGIIFITVSNSKYSTRANNCKEIEPNTYVMLDGKEKGIPHFIYTKDIIEEDFSNFFNLKIFIDSTNHHCIQGQLQKV